MKHTSARNGTTILIAFLFFIGFTNSQAQTTASGKILQIQSSKSGNQLQITVTAKNNASKYKPNANQSKHRYRVVLQSQRTNSSIFCSARIDESKWTTLKREQIGTFEVSTIGSCWDIDDFGNLFMISLAVDSKQGEVVVDQVAAKMPD